MTLQIMKFKDLPPNKSLRGVIFLHPETGMRCELVSFWNMVRAALGE